MEPDVFPTLTRQLAKDGVDLQTLEAQVAKQAREKMAIQVVGLWLPGEVVQALIGEYKYVFLLHFFTLFWDDC